MRGAVTGHRAVIAMTSHALLGTTGRATGAYLPEVADAWSVFARWDLEVDLVSVRGGEPPMEGVNLDDPVQTSFLGDGPMRAKLAATSEPDDLDPEDYSVVLFAGGHGSAWDFPDQPGLARLARGVYEHGGVVAAVCHGPTAFVGLKLSDGRHLVDGRRVACFTNDEERAVGMCDIVPFLLADRLSELGAIHDSAAPFMPHTVVDGRLVTGQNPASAATVAEQAVAVLAGCRLPILPRRSENGSVPRRGSGSHAVARFT